VGKRKRLEKKFVKGKKRPSFEKRTGGAPARLSGTKQTNKGGQRGLKALK